MIYKEYKLDTTHNGQKYEIVYLDSIHFKLLDGLEIEWLIIPRGEETTIEVTDKAITCGDQIFRINNCLDEPILLSDKTILLRLGPAENSIYQLDYQHYKEAIMNTVRYNKENSLGRVIEKNFRTKNLYGNLVSPQAAFKNLEAYIENLSKTERKNYNKYAKRKVAEYNEKIPQ